MKVNISHSTILDSERDHRQRSLNLEDWPQQAADQLSAGAWEPVEDCDALSRIIAEVSIEGPAAEGPDAAATSEGPTTDGHTDAANTSGKKPGNTRKVREYLLRFPSSPLLGVNRLKEHQFSLREKAPLFHTYRLLVDDARPLSDTLDHVFILHNGLDERDDLVFHHDFGSRIVLNDPSGRTGCIIRPFPGHLTRYPFSTPFAQTPLDRYLDDAGDLFRQFMRSMTEARWLLSVIAPLDRYNSPTGADLLGTSGRARSDKELLAEALITEWEGIRSASHANIARPANPAEQPVAETASSPPELEFEAVRRAIASLRRIVGVEVTDSSEVAEELGALKAVGSGQEGDEKLDEKKQRAQDRAMVMSAATTVDAAPSIHVTGYSLGGFVAQSVFSLFPYLVSGCTTILSGGALKSVTPTAFAHPEEWQTVLHALRYELDDAMLKRRMKFPDRDADDRNYRFDDDSPVLGVSSLLTDAFLRVFYEVFEQEYASSYRSRLAELGRRMLFVVGGADEIVRTQSVIDAAPREGINLIEIANLSHFLGRAAKEPAEDEQRAYWLPEVAGVVFRFAQHAESLRAFDVRTSWLRNDLSRPALSSKIVLSGDLECGRRARPPDVQPGGVLPSPDFERYLDFLVARSSVEHRGGPVEVGSELDGDGALYVLQNWVPSVLLSPAGQRERAIALHHADGEVSRYLVGLRRRASILSKNQNRVHFIVPKKAADWHDTRDMRHPSRSETIPGLLRNTPSDRGIAAIPDQWPKAYRIYDAEAAYGTNGKIHDDTSLLATTADLLVPTLRGGRDPRRTLVTSLPNVWIWAGVKIGLNPNKFLETCREYKHDHLGSRPIGADDVKDLIAEDQLVIVRLSGSVYNPRFRGQIVQDYKQAHAILVHTALVFSAIASSEPSFPNEAQATPT